MHWMWPVSYTHLDVYKRQVEETPYPVRIVVPDADARSFDWFSMPSDEDDYTEYALSLIHIYGLAV